MPPIASGLSDQPWRASNAWCTQFGTGETDYVFQIAATPDGGLFVAGSTEGDLAEPNLGSTDAYIAKLDFEGEVEWQVQFGTDVNDVVMAVAADEDGNCYVAGETGGDFLGPGQGYDDAFVAKWDPNGEELWRVMAAEPVEEWVHDIAVDGDFACFVVTAHVAEEDFDAESQSTQICVIKIDDGGTELWRRWFGPYDGADVLVVTPDGQGGCTVTGEVYRDDNTFLVAIGLDDYGAEIAGAEYAMPAGMYSSGSCLDTDGNVYFAVTNEGGEDVFVAAFVLEEVDGSTTSAED